MAEVVSFAYAKLVERGGKPAPRNGANVPPPCFAPAGTSARKGEGARELLPVQTAEHVAPKTVPRGSLVSHDAVITLTFPGEEQPFRSAAPPGMKAPLYPFTPVVADPAASASGGGRAAQRLQAQADRGAVTNAVRVAAKAWRHSATGDAESGTPPFAQITVSPASPMHPPRVGCHHLCRPSIRRKGMESRLESRALLLHHLSAEFSVRRRVARMARSGSTTGSPPSWTAASRSRPLAGTTRRRSAHRRPRSGRRAWGRACGLLLRALGRHRQRLRRCRARRLVVLVTPRR